MSCVRRAWLVLGANTLPLEDEDAGYVCPSLDLGFPEVREVVSNRPDHHGVDDRTQYFGARAITAELVANTPGRIDEVAASFAPFMLPNVRPELHYVLDREDNPERVLVVRAAGYTWPIAGASKRDIHLAWVASDPIAWDPVTHESFSWAGSSGAPGRLYSLTFPRAYPVGTTAPSSGVLQSNGDVPVRPLLLFYGPIVGPRVVFQDPQANRQNFAFKTTTTIDAGHWIEVDPDARTAYWDSDRSRSAMREINWWYPTTWILCQPGVRYTFALVADGGGAGQSTQVRARWRDGYLS